MEMDRLHQSLPAFNVMNAAATATATAVAVATDGDDRHLSSTTGSARSVTEHRHMYRKNSAVSGILLTDLPTNLRHIVDEIGLELDLDGDGRMDTNEIKIVVGHLVAKTQAHAVLKKMVVLLGAFAVFLAATLFATSIAAARLAMDTSVDADTGIMYANTNTGGGGGNSNGAVATQSSVMKVTTAEFRRKMGIADMTNAQLDLLTAILPGTSGVKFQVKGYARSGAGTGTGTTVDAAAAAADDDDDATKSKK